MLRLSHRHCAALEAVVHIAYAKSSEPVSGRALAEAMAQQPRYLEPMLQKLVRAGILRGVRGPKGGYILAKERRRVTVETICNALGATEGAALSTALGQTVIKPLCTEALSAGQAALANTTLETLCERAQNASLAPLAQSSQDFTI